MLVSSGGRLPYSTKMKLITTYAQKEEVEKAKKIVAVEGEKISSLLPGTGRSAEEFLQSQFRRFGYVSSYINN